MKIALAQINTIVGAIEDNTNKVIEYIKHASSLGADLVAFPELTFIGYPPKDLLHRNSFIRRNNNAINVIIKLSKKYDVGIFIGHIEEVYTKKNGKKLYNAVSLIHKGKIISKHYKTLLPNFDVFDEPRYFEPARDIKIAKFKGKKIAVLICADLLNELTFLDKKLYSCNPLSKLIKTKPDFVVHMSASPFRLGIRPFRTKIYSHNSKKYNIPIIQINMVGGNDNLIFEGWSNVWNNKGKIIAQAKSFKEDLVVCDLNGKNKIINYKNNENIEEIYEAIKLGIHDYVNKTGFMKVILGISGGIDSALVATIAANALGKENVIGVSMPSKFTSELSKNEALNLSENLGIMLLTIPIENIFNIYIEEFPNEFKNGKGGLAQENLQARIRANILMSLANKFQYLLLATGNKSEFAMGYSTLYGDMCGALAPIGDLTKTKVYELSNYINKEKEIIPKNIISRPPTAELREGQLDTDSLPPYEILDPIVEAYIEEFKNVEEIIKLGYERELVKRVIKTIDMAEFKRNQAPIILKITKRAFGNGYRMPIVKKV